MSTQARHASYLPLVVLWMLLQSALPESQKSTSFNAGVKMVGVEEPNIFEKNVSKRGKFPPGFHRSEEYKGRVYLLSDSRRLFNIDHAETKCEAFGGYLAEIDDKDEMKFLSTFTYQFWPSLGLYFYTGGNQLAQRGNWVYKNSKKKVPSELWNPHGICQHCPTTNCATLQSGRGNLEDNSCEFSFAYICEVPLRQ